MKNINEVLASVAGKSPEEQAKIISAFYADKRRKQTIDDARRDVRSKCFAGCKKLTKQQQEAFLYEYLSKNANNVNTWLRTAHSEVFEVQQGTYKPGGTIDSK